MSKFSYLFTLCSLQRCLKYPHTARRKHMKLVCKTSADGKNLKRFKSSKSECAVFLGTADASSWATFYHWQDWCELQQHRVFMSKCGGCCTLRVSEGSVTAEKLYCSWLLSEHQSSRSTFSCLLRPKATRWFAPCFGGVGVLRSVTHEKT